MYSVRGSVRPRLPVTTTRSPGLQRIARHADVGELEPIVHLEPPRLAAALGVDRDDDERVRVDELEFRDDALDALLARAVVDGADRMVRRRREARAREHPGRYEAGRCAASGGAAR